MNQEFNNKVLDILESAGNGTEAELIACENKIHEFAEYARSTEIFKNTEPKYKNFFNGSSPTEIYTHMLQKIVSSPTILHRDGAVILTIPHLSDALKNIKTE